MDKTARYRELIKRYLSDFSGYANRAPHDGIETECAFDETHDQYFLVSVGWADRLRIRNTLLHVRLRDGKIWVEEDWTEEGIATALVREGVPHQDIVLAFHPPELRHLTEFAPA
jgi:hypothetical protein